ncbi:MAG: hypothetical protein E7614_08525 [Ruminococcaceae bacterium]|nr:hypothetical protein [Oscillospiraceae bacterium]
MSEHNTMKKVCFLLALVFVVGVYSHAICFADSQNASKEVSGRMITEHLTEETTSCTETANPIQLHTFMIACLVILGGALGMVLLNMKLDRKDDLEPENEKDAL